MFIPIQKTYADYSDLNENSVVNFNQYISKPYVNIQNDVSASYFDSITSFQYIANHKIFLKTNAPSGNLIALGQSSTRYHYLDGNMIFTYTSGLTFNSIIYSTGLQSGVYYLNFIDLTQMFGDGNEPNLEQCNEYFTSNYYDYTTGIAMPYSKGYLQGYKDGAKDTLESLHATYNNDILGTIAYPVNYNDIESNLTYDTDNDRYILYGISGLNFGDYITSTIKYKGTYFMPNYLGGVYIVFFKYEGGVMNPIATSEIVVNQNMDAEHYWNGSCNIQFNINNQDIIYFGFFTSYGTFNDSTATTMVAWSSELEIQTLNINAIIQSAIAKGQRDVLNQYEPGGIAYESIYQQGFNEGLARENGFGTALELVGTTFSKVGEILQIQILPGIPVGLFVVFPLLVGLIIFIVKMVKGGG